MCVGACVKAYMMLHARANFYFYCNKVTFNKKTYDKFLLVWKIIGGAALLLIQLVCSLLQSELKAILMSLKLWVSNRIGHRQIVPFLCCLCVCRLMKTGWNQGHPTSIIDRLGPLNGVCVLFKLLETAAKRSRYLPNLAANLRSYNFS